MYILYGEEIGSALGLFYRFSSVSYLEQKSFESWVDEI